MGKKEYLFNSRLSKTEILYLFFCLAVYLFWTSSFGTYEYGPDEFMRLDIPKFIFQHGTLPYGWEEELRNPAWGFSYGFGFSLPYAIGALLMKEMSLFSSSARALTMAARITSVLCGVGIGYYAIRISQKLFVSRARWLFIVLMTLLPQVVFLSSYYNLDIFGLLIISMIVFCWLSAEDQGWSISCCCRLAVALGLCFLSYEFAYPYILGSFILYITWYVKSRKSVSFKAFFLKGLLILGIVFLICGWSFIRNAILYDGDIFVLKIREKYQELYAIDNLKPSNIQTFRSMGKPFLYALQDDEWTTFTCRSFVSVMGYMTVYADQWVYTFFRILLFFSGIGLIVPSVLKLGNSGINHSILLALVISSAVTILLSVYYSWNVDIQPQGRYIIGILPLFALFTAKGTEGLGQLTAHGLELDESRVTATFIVFLCAVVLLTVLEAYGNCAARFL